MVHRALEGRRGLKVQAEDEQRDGSGPALALSEQSSSLVQQPIQRRPGDGDMAWLLSFDNTWQRY